MDFKKKITKEISTKIELDEETTYNLLEIPRDLKHGDFALPCFNFAKKHKKNPQDIAEELSKKLNSTWFTTQNTGPYVNFTINPTHYIETILKNITHPQKFNFFNKKIGLESPSPNSNKPLHLGHVRNMLLGLSLYNIYKKVGFKVTWFDLVNDRGTHICKSMISYLLKGNNQTPTSTNKKGDQFVGDFYVLYSKLLKENPDLENKAQEMLVSWEKKNTETIALWAKMRTWWLEGVKKTYQDYGLKIDVQNFESDIFNEGKKLVKLGLEKGVFQKDETNAVFVNLEHKDLGKKYLLRSDGTSIYMTQDLYLAKKRFDDYSLDEFRYIVGSEQIYHFNTLFEILKLLNFDFAKKCKHISYGLIHLPHGRMKSREGQVVDADDFLSEMLSLAEIELKNRYNDITPEELERRKKIIAIGAINFFILKHDSIKDFVYVPDKSLSFQGDSGPYIQYSHARICAILRKQEITPINDFSTLNQFSEKKLTNKLNEYPLVVLSSANNNKPSLIANYLLELAQLFNSYYQETQILVNDPPTRNARLFLIDKIRIIIKDGLSLLGITAPEEM